MPALGLSSLPAEALGAGLPSDAGAAQVPPVTRNVCLLVRQLSGLALLLVVTTSMTTAASSDLFVAPYGNDRDRGTQGHPFRTLERARNAIRALKRRADLPARGVTVWVRGGTHELNDTFSLTVADSGAPERPVVYQAWPGEEVRLVGGKRVSDWQPVSDPAILARLPAEARGRVWQADLAALGIRDLGRLTSRGFGRPVSPAHLELFHDGRPMTLARWPNEGFATIAGIPAEAGSNDGHGGTIGSLQAGFYYNGDRPAGWRNTGDIWVHGYWAWDWANSYERVASLDTQKRLIRTAPPHGLYGFRAGQRFYFLNILEELDQPGEYFVDRESGILYFWPPAPLEEAETWVSVLEKPMILVQEASHVALRGFTLECSRGNGIEVRGGSGVRVEDCTLRNLGNWGIRIGGGTEHGVSGCHLYHLGDGGVYLEGGDRRSLIPAGHFVEDCDIHDMGRWSKCYQPGVHIRGVGNRVAHCRIHDGPHNGILLSGNEHLIEFNELYELCRETGDVGAFYLGRDWTERGNVVRYNFFHHLGGLGLGSMAVYLDDCASGVTVFGNVFYRVQRAAFIGGGRDNRVENNVFVECHPAVQIDGRGLDPSPVWHNMVYQTMKQRLEEMNWRQPPYAERYPRLADLEKYYERDEGVPPEGNVVARNICVGEWLSIHWHAQPQMVEVRANLVDQDPRFVDAEAMNFQLREDSPAWELGFERIPLGQIGPRQR